MEDLLEDTNPTHVPMTEADYARLAKLNAGLAKLTEEMEALKARVRVDHAVKGTFVHGDVVVKVTPVNRKDVEKTMEKYPVETFPAFYKTVLDLPKVKDPVLEPTTYSLSISYAS